jgi:hypothetical protein
MAATSLHLLAKQALGQLDTLTFNISSVQAKAFKTGNVGFRVTTDQGTVVTFWSSTMDQVVEALDDAGNFQVIPGVRLAKDDDGSFGLIDPSRSTSIWS